MPKSRVRSRDCDDFDVSSLTLGQFDSFASCLASVNHEAIVLEDSLFCPASFFPAKSAVVSRFLTAKPSSGE